MDLLWIEFVNSDWRDWRGTGRSEDRLENETWMERFLQTWQLAIHIRPEPPELSDLKALRRALRRMAEQLAAGRSLSPDDIDYLNALMADGPVTRRIEGDPTMPELHLQPMHTGWKQVMAEVTASFAATLTTGESGRVRVCDNQDCSWVFYDDTRNRSKRFCDDKTCGNLMKVRRFRARNKAPAK